ncbi:hypothetical protein [Cohnella fermenti]|uniref:Uncharacterized protein n=1 Tax=Cohnella fermenti TaxID=2565925 RepID=A0A4S4C641_9BACL|nr:hypothetical protein [Cohnella fermenti]THF83331.1 hypothetical protein E6C55_05635 [Cohnella fermenti]
MGIRMGFGDIQREHRKPSKQSNTSTSETANANPVGGAFDLSRNPAMVRPEQVMQLQRQIGNRAVGALLRGGASNVAQRATAGTTATIQRYKEAPQPDLPSPEVDSRILDWDSGDDSDGMEGIPIAPELASESKAERDRERAEKMKELRERLRAQEKEKKDKIRREAEEKRKKRNDENVDFMGKLGLKNKDYLLKRATEMASKKKPAEKRE